MFQSFDPTSGGDDLDVADLADDFKHRIDPRAIAVRRFAGRASVAIAAFHPRRDFIWMQQAALASGETTLLDLAAKPFVVARGGREKGPG